MKKYILLYIGLFTLILGGCGKQNKMPDFIPTPTVSPTPIIEDTEKETEEDKSEEEVPIEELDLSEVETTRMYVKMSKYGSTLNIRSKPSTDGDILGYLVHSEKVEVIRIKDGWAAIKDDNMVKYVNSDYLVEEKPEYLNPPTATPTPVPTPTTEPSEEI
ncbi:MAG: SH3 domain-containing protein [Clostridiales bacterium]|jgi:hypothetical protein|nr:SH3 domain-containing protein [Clostridiales bacterium]